MAWHGWSVTIIIYKYTPISTDGDTCHGISQGRYEDSVY